jgi:hypothetical protein
VDKGCSLHPIAAMLAGRCSNDHLFANGLLFGVNFKNISFYFVGNNLTGTTTTGGGLR